MCEFERWLNNAEDGEVKDELLAIVGNEREIEDRFYKNLAFGTGGLRGVIGAGTNRMNIYTVGKATFGLAEYMLKSGGKSIVIAYDSRNKSAEFARLAAEIMSARGIKAHLFPELTPTPVLSFAVRYLKADVGIVITASHNPKEYNGYKVYNSNGCQITDDAAAAITREIDKFDFFNKFTPNEELISTVSDEVGLEFIKTIKEFSLTAIDEKNAPAIVYSPLHGTGRKYVQKILSEIGIKNLRTVAEQEMPDGNFTTCPYPNPEEKAALSLVLRDAEIYKPDLVMATDPDADRIGIAVPDENGEYVLLNGNETGCILLYYILLKKKENGSLKSNATAVKTIVTTDLIFDMAQEFGINVKEVLTGFKYIGEAMDTLENYLFGLEESYGYLIGTHARDKDAVSAAMLIAEACAYFKGEGKSLYSVLGEIYKRYGYYTTSLKSVSMPGKDGMERMAELLKSIRQNPLKQLGGKELVFDDFKDGIFGLPKSDVLRFKNNDYRLIIRPSGTEPKIKIYMQARGVTPEKSAEMIAEMDSLINEMIK